ncbi:hypothetical protein QTO34_009971 [Cnephaeus nilssonii]|uniref:Uncharacterized protein n=1 Tax=Cnephaeus nilssonii TaxID=3371016 RepID=A0AA40LFL1_CNENI|nr:hypothetical protein QTO34_009971 [Eptesicus nilssonii]
MAGDVDNGNYDSLLRDSQLFFHIGAQLKLLPMSEQIWALQTIIRIRQPVEGPSCFLQII